MPSAIAVDAFMSVSCRVQVEGDQTKTPLEKNISCDDMSSFHDNNNNNNNVFYKY